MFDADEGKVVVHHLQSIELTHVTSQCLFAAIEKVFGDYQLPWQNLTSVLLDSCNVMRGKQSGLETLLRKKNPHLLNIDGDACHHLHNASKRFCDPFKEHVEDLFRALYADFQHAPDLRAALCELCELLGIAFTVPARFISHR